MEGSRSALEYLGGRVLDYGDIDHVFFLDDKRAAREAAPYYFLSANLGYKVAARRIARWGKKYPGIFGIDYANAESPLPEFREIFCPVRIYDTDR